MIEPPPLYKLLDRELLQRLMQRTGTGAGMSLRQLSDAAGVPKSTIHGLVAGTQQSVLTETAHRIARAIGVDVLILFAPVGRSVALPDADEAPAVTA